MIDHHSNLSKEDLIKKINSLESLVEALKQEKDQDELLNFPWIGNLGHWHWDVQNDNLICNDWKILALNYRKDIEIGKFANDIKITISCGVKEYKK